ncbi:ATP-dependent DNA helicase UvrD2 [Sporichthya polymorpha]|uniref:ATP-dependent DNA helicase UvrD2 n=1 Tax=Sporichthya polymorpha TaxID=35751 RepID=UPI0006873721|nr:ATP-dependent DNA helicase UvrD2 [Sporichthya polymorpha]
MSDRQILDALDPEQREVAEALEGPVCVLAGAGTGKTRAITHRIAHGVRTGVYPPQCVLAVTFTTRAAGEMRTRLRALGAAGVQARTFHSAALRQLQYFWPMVVGGELPTIEAKKAPLVAAAASRVGVRPGQAEVRDLAAEIEWAKVSQIAPAEYARAAAAAGRTPPAGLDPAGMAELYGAYEDTKRSRGIIDMEDILLLTVGVLADSADAAEQVRRQYRHFVVDEYQDVSPLQQRLLDLWLGDRHEVCVVGDPAQTIYSFAGATPDHLLQFSRQHPGARVVRLTRNYRSTPEVIALANRVLVGATPADGPRTGDLRAQRPAGVAPTLAEYPDEEAEAAAVADRIAALREEGVPASQIAVLFRTNGQSLAYEQALADRGVPYLLRGGEKFFERPEVREARVRLRGAARSIAAGTDTELEGGRGLVDTVRDVLASAGLSTTSDGARGAAAERAESLAALVRIAEELAVADPGATLATLVTELDTRAADAHVPVVEGVTLASLHAAKGLEWDAVFLVGLVEGMLPITYADTDEAVAEERRLFYVGLTRARDRLFLSWATARTPGGRGNRRPSRFLDGLVAVEAGPRRPAKPKRDRGKAVTSCRVCGKTLVDAVARKLGRCTDCPSDYDEELLERLKAWRLARAREASLPAYCVFTDATLQAIAEAEPGDLRALGRIAGIGASKLDRYGTDVLAICAGEPVGASSAAE